MRDNLSQYYSDIVNSLAEFVKISTVYDGATVSPEAPYGQKIHQGYLWLRDKALQDGFEVLEYGGRALAIRIPGIITPDRIDVVAHLDVVEPGSGWELEPFGGQIRDGFLYGRGTQDMKGTLILSYYALKFIMDQKIPLKKELRVVFGCDEERTMDDMKYYVSQAGEPTFAYTPDGKFPYSLGEKGALMWTLEGSVESCIYALDGGVKCNVVSPFATALVKGSTPIEVYEDTLNELGIQGELTPEEEFLRLKVWGKAAHASVPEDGLNATVLLLQWISAASQDPLARLLYRAFEDAHGRGADIYYAIEPMGLLTLNLGVLKIKDSKLTAEVDCRYPYGVTSEELTRRLQKALNPLSVALDYDDKPTLADKNSPYLKVLLETYREITGHRSAEPIISGGVSYSKVFKNCVAFGPHAEGEEMLAHQANERIALNKLMELFEIYTTAMIRLGNLK
jgi:succinyl-diaminopimelate desuccinylase